MLSLCRAAWSSLATWHLSHKLGVRARGAKGVCSDSSLPRSPHYIHGRMRSVGREGQAARGSVEVPGTPTGLGKALVPLRTHVQRSPDGSLLQLWGTEWPGRRGGGRWERPDLSAQAHAGTLLGYFWNSAGEVSLPGIGYALNSEELQKPEGKCF